MLYAALAVVSPAHCFSWFRCPAYCTKYLKMLFQLCTRERIWPSEDWPVPPFPLGTVRPLSLWSCGSGRKNCFLCCYCSVCNLPFLSVSFGNAFPSLSCCALWRRPDDQLWWFVGLQLQVFSRLVSPGDFCFRGLSGNRLLAAALVGLHSVCTLAFQSRLSCLCFHSLFLLFYIWEDFSTLSSDPKKGCVQQLVHLLVAFLSSSDGVPRSYR